MDSSGIKFKSSLTVDSKPDSSVETFYGTLLHLMRFVSFRLVSLSSCVPVFASERAAGGAPEWPAQVEPVRRIFELFASRPM